MSNTFNLNQYVNAVKEQCKVERKQKESKVEKQLIALVKEMTEGTNKEATTYSNLSKKTGKHQSQLRAVVNKSKALTTHNVAISDSKYRVLVIPAE